MKIHHLSFELLTFLGVSAVAFVLTTILVLLNHQLIFKPFFGTIHPLIALSVVILIATLLIYVLTTQAGFSVMTGRLQGLLWSLILALIFSILIVTVDSIARFPENLNIPFPQSIFFYPAIGYVVEAVFHLLPLTVLFIIARTIFHQTDTQHIIWGCILIVAMIEPVYQTIGFIGLYPAWVVIYVAGHIFAINLAQLIVFRQYDFMAMITLRMGYYLIWHIIWGHFRLDVLF